MGVEALDSNMDFGGDTLDEGEDTRSLKTVDIDARRRLEDKIEEMRLRREMQEFDFDV